MNIEREHIRPPTKKSAQKQNIPKKFTDTETEFCAAGALDGTLWIVVDTEPEKKNGGTSKRWAVDRLMVSNVWVIGRRYASRRAAVKAALDEAKQHNTMLRK